MRVSVDKLINNMQIGNDVNDKALKNMLKRINELGANLHECGKHGEHINIKRVVSTDIDGSVTDEEHVEYYPTLDHVIREDPLLKITFDFDNDMSNPIMSDSLVKGTYCKGEYNLELITNEYVKLKIIGDIIRGVSIAYDARNK